MDIIGVAFVVAYVVTYRKLLSFTLMTIFQDSRDAKWYLKTHIAYLVPG